VADPAALRILVVEDDPAMVAIIRHLLQSAGYQRITTATTGAEALARADDADLVLLDHQLPDTTGIDLVPRLVARPDPPSVIMVTGAGNETLAAAALRDGAEDYLAKDGNLRALLPQIVERTRRYRALREAQTAVEEELVRAERLAAIGEMAVTLHHEINNPLMAASAEVELLLADPGLDEAKRASLASVRLALGRIRDIIRQAGELRQAVSHDYMAGLRMIRLASDAATMPHRGRALLWIADEEVARLTALVLRHHGFMAERVSSPRELATGAERLGVSLVVLSAVGSADPADALAGFTPGPERSYALVALVAGDPTGARAAGADRVVPLPFDPATLADELVGAVDERQG
jgi:DNA-binding response OmpR family regulator